LEGSSGNPFEFVINPWYDIIVPILGIAPNMTSTLLYADLITSARNVSGFLEYFFGLNKEINLREAANLESTY
jgi:hypothetical protein